MTDNELFHWLEQQNLTRDNIGEMLGYSKRTVDNWYSDQKIPDPARQHLRRIITESQQPGSLRFTLSQWDSIEAARIAAGYTDRTEFFTAALTDYARQSSVPCAHTRSSHTSSPASSLRMITPAVCGPVTSPVSDVR